MYPVYSMVESKVITNMCLKYVILSLSLFLSRGSTRTFVMSDDCIAIHHDNLACISDMMW